VRLGGRSAEALLRDSLDRRCGGTMSYLELSAHMTVRPGCLEGFKKQAAECIRITNEKDTGTLRYDWFLSIDGTECEVREAYTGPEALDRAQHPYPRSSYEAVQGLRGRTLHDRVRRALAAAARSAACTRRRIHVVLLLSGAGSLAGDPVTHGGAAMTPPSLEAKVDDFLAQKRIAVAGVSRDKGHHPVAQLIYQRLKTTGHDVFAVNPHMETFEGDRCYPDLQSIPGGVDGVVIVTRPETTERIVRDCGDARVRRVWMHQSIGKGTSVSPEAVEYCRQRDITVIAGACPMMYGAGADFGHTCMRVFLRLTGGLPA